MFNFYRCIFTTRRLARRFFYRFPTVLAIAGHLFRQMCQCRAVFQLSRGPGTCVHHPSYTRRTLPSCPPRSLLCNTARLPVWTCPSHASYHLSSRLHRLYRRTICKFRHPPCFRLQNFPHNSSRPAKKSFPNHVCFQIKSRRYTFRHWLESGCHVRGNGLLGIRPRTCLRSLCRAYPDRSVYYSSSSQCTRWHRNRFCGPGHVCDLSTNSLHR